MLKEEREGPSAICDYKAHAYQPSSERNRGAAIVVCGRNDALER